jgi:O-antigen/teichoic acid export membrane protein
LGEIVSQTSRITLWQLPIVAIGGVGVWFLLPADWAALQKPLVVLLAALVCLFPLRIFHAVLQGVQDLAFAAKVQLYTWCVGTIITITLIWYGLGLYALSIGWAISQFLSVAAAWWRLRRRFPNALPRPRSSLPRPVLVQRLTQGFWVSVAQVAQVLVQGTDVVIVGRLLGPAAVVPYACTGKLASVLANQPHLLLEMVRPALSEMKMGDASHRLPQVTTALSLAVLLLSGLLVCVVLAVNEGFVRWWVGVEQYGGLTLTGAFVLSVIARHWNSTVVHALFCFGYERWISITTLLDGLVTIAAAIMLTWFLGPIGAIAGSIVGVSLVSLPLNLSALAREVDVTTTVMLVPLAGWFWRAGLLCAVAALSARIWIPIHGSQLVLTVTATVLLYVVVMFRSVLQSPLAAYLRSGLFGSYGLRRLDMSSVLMGWTVSPSVRRERDRPSDGRVAEKAVRPQIAGAD